MSEKMIYKGQHMQCLLKKNGIAELYLDHGSASVNKFDKSTLGDLRSAINAIKEEKAIKGLIIGSSKSVFVVGADITEFKSHFSSGTDALTVWLQETHALFADIEDLPYPTVAAINGVCLGGGMELALTTSFRVASETARVGLPETKLGIYPGWGGTIRLPRMIGADNAIEWIAGGGTFKPDQAMKIGVVDTVVNNEKLWDSCRDILEEANAGKLNWEMRRKEKISPLKIITPIEAAMIFEGAKGFVAAKTGGHYPAPIAAVQAMQDHAGKTREEASKIEIEGFVKLAQSSQADNLVTLFLSDQFNKKKSKGLAKKEHHIKHVGVLGAGIMGGGIAYQSASKGIPILMKDIQQKALDLGLNEAAKLLNKQMTRGKINSLKMAEVMGMITPSLSYSDFQQIDLVIEAVVENEKVKRSVFKELENNIGSNTIIASNTSTISISKLAQDLKRPENFCGIHFFNPVHRMPLVEIIKGEKTSDEAISKAVSYVLQIGKTPIVVNDCPGFLVNRILFPYFFGFQQLLNDGVDFKRIDKVMEKFGWPMGPAYLLDVVGIDTAKHASSVMADGFPDRMSSKGPSAISVLNEQGRYGQKNAKGFYKYELDKKGKPKKVFDSNTLDLLKPIIQNTKQVSDEEIIDRMMIPMINESARCLEENIVSSAMEVDLGLLYGLGFPPFRGGILKYADDQGLANLLEKTKKYASLGEAYTAAPLLSEQKNFYR